MVLDKNKYNIYLTTSLITAALIFMGVSTWMISGDIESRTSRDIAIDKMVDQCWEKHGLE